MPLIYKGMFSLRNGNTCPCILLCLITPLVSAGVCEDAFSEFGFSMRVTATLKVMSIRSTEELTLITPEELLRNHNFGKTSLTEIQEALAKKGLSLYDSASDPSQLESLSLSAKLRRTLKDRGIHTVEKLTSQEPYTLLQLHGVGRNSLAEVNEALSAKGLSLSASDPSKVESLSLSTKLYKILKKMDIHTIEELISITPEELLQLPNLKQHMLNEVQRALSAKGLSLSEYPTGKVVIQDRILEATLRSSVHSLDLPFRIDNSFIFANINTLKELVSKTPEELSKVLSSTSDLSTVQDTLSRMGLSLRSNDQ